MTCKDLMTSKPACCTPNDTAAKAAQLMKSKDVGPIPVVAGESDKRVVGIVTDRDLALKVIAEGRDANTVLVEEVMTRHPACCQESEDLESALRLMSMHQVRRVPVVDKNFHLVGIISQADIARELDDERTGAVVEDISSRSRSAMSWADHGGSDGAGIGWTAMAVGAGIGLGLMYLLDPAQGRSRRTRLRDTASRVKEAVHSQTQNVADTAQRAFSNEETRQHI